MIYLLPLYIPYPYTLKGKRQQKKSFSSALFFLLRLPKTFKGRIFAIDFYPARPIIVN